MGDDIKRMCKWDKKRLKKDLSSFSEAVHKPKFVCSRCVRVANSKKLLCDPVELEKKSKR